MSTLAQISTDLINAESFIENFGAAFETLKSHSSSIIAFSNQWESILSSFSTMRSSLAGRMDELEKKKKQLDSLENELANRQKELELRKKEVDSAEKSIDERRKALELKEKQSIGNAGTLVVKTEPPGDLAVDNVDEDASLRLCLKMDGKTLQLFLNDRFHDHESMVEEVYYAIRLSNDPARLVLDAMEGFFPPHLKKGNVEYEARVVRSSCVLLLEQLLKLKSSMKRAVKRAARKLAVQWREKMKLEGMSYAVVLGFLMLVAVYRLSADFDNNELESLLGMVDKHVADKLCIRLGISAGFSAQATSSAFAVETVQNDQPNLKTDIVPSISSGPSDLAVDNGGEDVSLRVCLKMDGKTLQLYLNDRFHDHESMGEEVYHVIRLSNDPARLVLDAMEGFFPPHLKKGNVEYEARVVRSSCVLLLEQLFKLKSLMKRAVKRAARKLAFQWRGKMKLEGVSYAVVLGFLMLVAVYRLSADFDNNELESLLGMVDKHVADKLCMRLGISAGFSAQATSSALAVETVQNDQPNLKTDIVPSISSGPGHELHSICENMDANGLRSYLIAHVKEQSLLYKKVLDALQFASDPARLVYHVVLGFYQSSSRIFPGDANKASCILLLEQLLELSPGISKEMKYEALKFAVHWKARFGKQGNPPLDVFGFLLFLTVYKLGCFFAGDELLLLFGTFYTDDDVYRLDLNPKLCHALCLETKIPDVVETLIEHEEIILAVRYICAFNLVDRFPPAPLLKRHVELETHDAVKKRRRKPSVNNTQNALEELNVLRAVLKCISDCKLESKYPPTALKERIHQLDKVIAEKRKNSYPINSLKEKEKTSKPSPETAKESEAQVAKKRAECTSTTEPQPPQQSQVKRLKLVAQTTGSPNNIAASKSTVQPGERQPQEPCSIALVKNDTPVTPSTAVNTGPTSEKTAVAAASSVVQSTKPLVQMTRSLGNSGGVAMGLASRPYSYMLPSHVGPNTFAPPNNTNTQQLVTHGSYPGMLPSPIPPGPVFNHPRPPPGAPVQCARPILIPPFGLQHVYPPPPS
ncbi:hypothetical protein Dimus_021751 [Dionaea muscipula]